MNLDRRTFLKAGSGAALAATVGCGRLPESLVMPFAGLGRRQQGPFQPPASDSIDLISHTLNRLSFGARPGDYQRIKAMAATPEEAVEAYIEEQLNPEAIADLPARRVLRRFETLSQPIGELYEYKEKHLLKEMVRSSVLAATLSERQIYEVMVQFWSDHFNIDPSKGDCQWLKTADQREVVRKHALGNFSEMLRASALSPAMLWYLDGRVNQKRKPEDKPNENYARELLELHTLGVHGGYTQKDVMEVARCLTGWTVRGRRKFFKGQVEFKPHLHDNGPKRVLGRHIPAGLGEKDLDRVLEIVSLHPSTARHIATKLCRRFIAEDAPESAVKLIAREFMDTHGDIRATLRTLFATDEFRSNRGNKFKRPFNYIVSALRAVDATTDAERPVLDYLLRMGHAPFHYPTPDGYPEEAAPWMGTLLWRWNFAVALSQNRIGGTRVDMNSLVRNAGGDEALMAHLLGRAATAEEIESYHNSGNGLALALACPAFQMC